MRKGMVVGLVAGFLMAGAVVAAEAPLTAVCELAPTQGNKVMGTVKFIQHKGYVTVKAHVTGLTPGKHGFHIHESGDCSAPDASSAKGHFNPGKHDHGAPGAADRHAGDLGNLNANAKGVANYTRNDKVIQLTGPDSIIGRGMIVHEKVDDYKTQPTGNAGARVACGEIKLVKEAETKK
ncbi:MAG TPA: superoxide dismutase family protein [bacterium]|nr:superoxide dismutase family protein [bacterium]